MFILRIKIMLEYCTEYQHCDFSLVLQPFSRNNKWKVFFFLIVNRFDFLKRYLDFFTLRISLSISQPDVNVT